LQKSGNLKDELRDTMEKQPGEPKDILVSLSVMRESQYMSFRA
jgi:hypothetical protein